MLSIFFSTPLSWRGGFPFQIKQPRYNHETEAAIEEARRIIAKEEKAKTYANLSELLDNLDED